MSLDIAILDKEGAPHTEISVSPDSHFQLMKQAEMLELSQLLRMRDYYEDVDYTVQETLLLRRKRKRLLGIAPENRTFAG